MRQNLKSVLIFYVMPTLCILIAILIWANLFIKNDYPTFNLSNLQLGSTKESNIVRDMVPKQYALPNSKISEPNLASEKSSLELAETVTNKINDIQNGVYKDTEQYFEPIDQNKAKSTEYILSEEFKDHSTRSTHLWVIWALWRNKEMKITDPIEKQVSYTSDNKNIVNIYLRNVLLKMNNEKDYGYKVDIILEYTLTKNKQTGRQEVFDVKLQAVKDIDDYYTKVNDLEKSEYSSGRKITSINSFTPENAKGYNYDNVKNVNKDKVIDVYNKNVSKTVSLVANGSNGIEESIGYGFFVRKGIIVTSWNTAEQFIKSGDKDQFAADSSGNLHKIQGVVSAAPELGMVFLKLQEEIGEPVTIGDASQLKKDDPVIVIGSPMGLSPITRVGLFTGINNDLSPNIRNSLPLGDADMGSPLFNMNGQVVGINYSNLVNDKKSNDISMARPATLFSDLINKLNQQNFDKIQTVSFNDINKASSLKKSQSNNKKINPKNKIYTSFTYNFDLLRYQSIELIDSRIVDGYLLLRYENHAEDFVSSKTVISQYNKEMQNKGFKIDTDNQKTVLTKNNETIRISQRYGYISIIYKK